MNRLLQFLRSEEAATAVEYAVMLAMILVSIMAAIGTVGSQSNGMWENNIQQLQSAHFGK